MADEQLKEEDRNIRRLRFLVDFSLQYIRKERLTHDQALGLVAWAREFALSLFPGKGETFDLIYGPRFRRAINERFRRS